MNKIILLSIVAIILNISLAQAVEEFEIEGKKYKNEEEYYSSPEYQLMIQEDEETAEYFPYGGSETNDTKEIKQGLIKEYEKKKIYKENLKCGNKLSFSNTMACLIVNWEDILYNAYKESGQIYLYNYEWASDNIAQEFNIEYFNMLKYNEAPYYYVQKIRSVLLVDGKTLIYIRVLIGKEKLENDETFLLLELEKEKDNKYFLSKTFTETAINTPTKPYKFP